MNPQNTTSPSPPLSARIIPPNTGKVIRAFGDEIVVHLDGEQTGGQFTMFTTTTPPGGGPPPHYHLNEQEWFMPLEGCVEFLTDNTWTEVPLGSVVFMPRGSVHTFRNPGSQPLKMLVHTAPSGFEKFFERCAREFEGPDPPDMSRLVAIAAEHGVHFVNP